MYNTEVMGGGVAVKLRDLPYYQVAPAGLVQIEYHLEPSTSSIWYDLSYIDCNPSAPPTDPYYCPLISGGIRLSIPGQEATHECPQAYCKANGVCDRVYQKHGAWPGEPSARCHVNADIEIETCTDGVGPQTFDHKGPQPDGDEPGKPTQPYTHPASTHSTPGHANGTPIHSTPSDVRPVHSAPIRSTPEASTLHLPSVRLCTLGTLSPHLSATPRSQDAQLFTPDLRFTHLPATVHLPSVRLFLRGLPIPNRLAMLHAQLSPQGLLIQHLSTTLRLPNDRLSTLGLLGLHLLAMLAKLHAQLFPRGLLNLYLSVTLRLLNFRLPSLGLMILGRSTRHRVPPH
jgi:hypothetical protein